MNTERSECLSSTLAETDVADAWFLGDVDDVFNRVRNVVPSEVVNAEVPKLGRVRVVMDRLLGVLVPPVVAQPDVEP